MDERIDSDDQTQRPSMTWSRLIDDHDQIERRCREIAALIRSAEPSPQIASVLLLRLALLVTDHLGIENQIVDLASVAQSSGHSHADTHAMAATLELLKQDWTRYLARWSPDAVADEWQAFTDDTSAIMARLSAQVMQENEILYAGALKAGVIAAGTPILH